MKKTTISLLVAGVLSISFANAAPEGFYVGADVGASKVQSKSVVADLQDDVDQYKIKRNSVAYAIRAGYKINSVFALEASLNQFGKYSFTDKDNEYNIPFVKNNANGGTVVGKFIFPIVDDTFDLYAKLGVGIVHNRLKTYNGITGEMIPRLDEDCKETKDRKTSGNLLVGVGAEFSLTDNFSLTAEYQYVRHTLLRKLWSEAQTQRGKPSYHTVAIGFNYYFGEKPAAPQQQMVETLESVTFNNDVLFGFNKSKLKPAATAKLADLANQINAIQAEQRSVQVAGYTDRIGSEAYNLKLSQKRADSVANYLGNRGVADITATGYGKSNPITGNQCDDVKGTKALIKCLAPDRRVEVNVQGIKK